ncbi:MAG: hypothetical protein Q9182_000652 [Xanthomendoza sp. 2 TL-2023]
MFENDRTEFAQASCANSLRFQEFLKEKKCEACQRSPGCKCLIQEGDEKCVSCAAAGQNCVFRRSIIASGSPGSFKWTELLEIDDTRLEGCNSNQSARREVHGFKRAFQACIHLANKPFARRVFWLDTGAEIDIISYHVLESLGLEKEEYQKAPLQPVGGSRTPTSQVTFDWHISRSCEIFTTTFAVIDDKLSEEFDILLGRCTIQDARLNQTRASNDPPPVAQDSSRFSNSRGPGQPVYQSSNLCPEFSFMAEPSLWHLLTFMDEPGPWDPLCGDYRAWNPFFWRSPFGRRFDGGSSLSDLQNASSGPMRDPLLNQRSATFQNNFKTSIGSLSGRKRRTFNDAEKQHIKLIRKRGACSECQRKKQKVVEAPRLRYYSISNQDTLDMETDRGFMSINLDRATADEGTGPTQSLPRTHQNLKVHPNLRVSREKRVQLVATLQGQIRRLNDELKLRQDASEDVPVLTEQDVIALTLSEDSQIAEIDPTAYESRMESRLIDLKQMSLEDWQRERTRKVTSLLPGLVDGEETPASIASSHIVDFAPPTAIHAIDDHTRLDPGTKSLRLGDSTSSNNESASHKKNNWICEICSTRIGTQRDLSRHKETQHKIKDGGGPIHKYLCAVDGCRLMIKEFNRRDNFRKHVQRMHPQEDVEDLLERSVQRVENTPISKVNGPAARFTARAMKIVLYPEVGDLHVDIRAKVDRVMPHSIISTAVLLQMKVSYMTCHKLELKDANGEIHRPVGKVLLRWHEVEVAKSSSETFYVVDSNAMFVTFGSSGVFLDTNRPADGSSLCSVQVGGTLWSLDHLTSPSL